MTIAPLPQPKVAKGHLLHSHNIAHPYSHTKYSKCSRLGLPLNLIILTFNLSRGSNLARFREDTRQPLEDGSALSDVEGLAGETVGDARQQLMELRLSSTHHNTIP